MRRLQSAGSHIRATIWNGALPVYPIAIAAYPIIAMLDHNRLQVHASVAFRPLLASLAAASTLLTIFRVISGSWRKSAMITTISLIFFFSYGHIYDQVKNANLFDFVIGRHRFLAPFFGLLLLAGILLIRRTRSDLDRATPLLNVFAVTLLLIPLVQFGAFLITNSAVIPRIVSAQDATESLSSQAGGDLPDIYFIILDAYTRADALDRDFSFDNSDFIDALEDRGFYVAACARSNYVITRSSLSSALNLAYHDNLLAANPDLPATAEEEVRLLRYSKARSLLEEAGYKTVAFESGYEMSTLRDADYFLSLERDPITLQHFDPFEKMLLNTTALRLLVDQEVKAFQSRMRDIDEVVSISEFPFAQHVDRQLFIFDQLPEIARIPDPTFAFVHLTSTHGPYVFDAEGNLWSDEGFYSGPDDEPIDDLHLAKGYTSAIQYTNARILDAIDQIFESSRVPPIIIMQGDHGLGGQSGQNRLQIFSSYFLPGESENLLYPSISPINSFRVVFNTYFDTEFDLLEDRSYGYGSIEPVPERSEGCRHPDAG